MYSSRFRPASSVFCSARRSGSSPAHWSAPLASLGCLIGYGFGRFAGEILVTKLSRRDDLQRWRAALARYGIAALALFRPVPVLAEASVIAAGALRILSAGRFRCDLDG